MRVAKARRPPPCRIRHRLVSNVTVIPLESADTFDHIDPFLESLPEVKALGPEQSRRLASTLQPSEDWEGMSRADFMYSMRALRWLQQETSATEQQLNGYWHNLHDQLSVQVRILQPTDVAEVYGILASLNRRDAALVQVLNGQCQRLVRSFTLDEVALILRALGHMGWRSMKTVNAFNERVAMLLQNLDASRKVSTRHMATMVSIYPRLKISHSKPASLRLLKTVAVSVPSRLREMSPREYSLILNTYAKLGLASTTIHRNVTRMFEACANHLVVRVASGEENRSGFEPRDIALIANAYAQVRAGPFVLPLLQAISNAAVVSIGACNSQDVSNLLNAFSKFSISDSSAFEAAAPHIMQHIAQYDTQSLSNCAHAFAKQRVMHAALFEKLGHMSLRLLDRFKPQELANLAYAYGHLNLRHDSLVTGLRDEVLYRGTVGKSLQNINTLFCFHLRSVQLLAQAFTRLRVYDKRLLFVLFDMARERQRHLTRPPPKLVGKALATATANKLKATIMSQTPEMLDGHVLSNLLAAFARSKSDFHALLQWAPNQVTALDGQYTTWQLVSIFSSCSRLQLVNAPLFKHLLNHAKPRVTQMHPKAIGTLVQGLARAKLYNRVLMRNAVKSVSPRLKDLDVVDVSALMLGCARLGYRDERFLRLLATVARASLEDMSVEKMVVVLSAYSQMRIKHRKWFDAVLFALFKRQHELSEREATISAHAMLLIAAAERHDVVPDETGSVSAVPYPFCRHSGVMRSFLHITSAHRHDLTYPAVFQLQTIELFLRLLTPEVYTELPQDLKILLAKARAVNLAQDDYMKNTSKTHRRISQWFTRVGLHHRSEVALGPFTLDMVIGDRVLVEIDGPSHFYRDTNSRTSLSLLKHAILNAMGFHVCHLPYQEWGQCGTPDKKMLYAASFWREVLSVHMQAAGKSSRPLPLVDVMEMLTDDQFLIEGGTFRDPPLPRTRAVKAPAFYEQAEDEDEAGREEMSAKDTSVIDSELAGSRSVQDLLDAHASAEEQLIRDRQQSITAQERQRLDTRARRKEKETSADEWQRTFLSGNTSDPAASFHEFAADAHVKSLMPRSKRFAIKRGAQIDRHKLEAETDDSDDEKP